MEEQHNPTDRLLEKLNILQKKQDSVSSEMYQLRKEIYRMKAAESQQKIQEQASKAVNKAEENLAGDNGSGNERQYDALERENKKHNIWKPTSRQEINTEENGSNLEKFIGENLINKIGIAITIIGVSIGVKYSIDHDLISPATRIILGYLFGLMLCVLGFRLKEKYENYSAILVSGSMAILYFITYAAYSFYGLMPQILAFAVMVIITGSTVVAALNYDKQVIAHIGLVGAYAIPFLLSDDSGRVDILFSYMAIINIGILAISIKKNWEQLYVASFLLTWLMYFSWYKSKYLPTIDLELAFLFLGIFFAIFYITFLGYKVSKKKHFDITDILLVLANSFIFYGIGYSIIKSQPTGKEWLGLFTILNTVIHFAVFLVILQRKLTDKNLLNFVLGLVLVFVTISIPVQLDGNWVTLFWAGEMALLFWIGRAKKSQIYEILSYPLIVLTFLSIIQDWSAGYIHDVAIEKAVEIIPLFNIIFLTSIMTIASYGFMLLIDRDDKYSSTIVNQHDFLKLISFALPTLVLINLYFAFHNEIAQYWYQRYFDSSAPVKDVGRNIYLNYYKSDIQHLKSIWLVNYSLVFFTLLSLINIRKLKILNLGFINLIINTLVIIIFLTVGLYNLSVMRDNYLGLSVNQNDLQHDYNFWIRYISIAFFGLLLLVCGQYIRQEFMKKDFRMYFDFLLHISIIWVSSSELINCLNIAGSAHSYKFGLSILWGVYALLLIILGIWKKKKYLRIGAISLFTITLIKLFFYDLTKMDTISRTIVFVSLGTLLLVISFIYNKYKNIILD